MPYPSNPNVLINSFGWIMVEVNVDMLFFISASIGTIGLMPFNNEALLGHYLLNLRLPIFEAHFWK